MSYRRDHGKLDAWQRDQHIPPLATHVPPPQRTDAGIRPYRRILVWIRSRGFAAGRLPPGRCDARGRVRQRNNAAQGRAWRA
jgi:hypothetical protein